MKKKLSIEHVHFKLQSSQLSNKTQFLQSIAVLHFSVSMLWSPT
jgi:hypothetical protein